MKVEEWPVACRLTDAEMQKRREDVLQRAGRAVLESKELESGYAYRFPADESWLAELAQIIGMERQCCPFLTFRMTAEAGFGAIWLELSGPEGTKDFLKSFFQWN